MQLVHFQKTNAGLTWYGFREATKTEPSRRPLKDDDTPTYRDRAKERREGIEAEDFANPQSILNLLYAK